jgi:hypothetical protein
MCDNRFIRNMQHMTFSLKVKHVTCMESAPNFGMLVIKKTIVSWNLRTDIEADHKKITFCRKLYLEVNIRDM